MRIAINGLFLIPGGVGGSEIYLRSLVRALAKAGSNHEFILFLARESAESFPVDSMPVVTTPVNAVHRPQRLLFEQFRLPQLCRKHGIDVLLNAGFTGPFFPECPMATVVLDLQFRDHPEFFSAAELWGWRFFVGWTIRRSDRLIAISQWTRQRLQAHYRLDSGRIDVIPIGVAEDLRSIQWTPDPHDRYLLTISTLHPHKNLDTLLRAFALFATRHPEIRLVIAGLKGRAADQLLHLRRELGLQEKVHFTYWIPREALYGLLKRCWAFVFPSRYEGFGMPVAEALSLGIPTICSDAPALDEVAGQAALRFSKDSAQELAFALARITHDETLRAELSRQGPQQAAKFHWPAIARAMIGTLEKTYSSAKT